MNRVTQYAIHLAASVSAVSAVLLPYFGQDRWFVAFPAAAAGLAALGVGQQTQAQRQAAATPTSLPGGPQ